MFELGDLLVNVFDKEPAMINGIFEVDHELVMLRLVGETFLTPALDLQQNDPHNS